MNNGKKSIDEMFDDLMKVVDKYYATRRSTFPLPRLTLILDLDETLVHSELLSAHMHPSDKPADLEFTIFRNEADQKSVRMFKRPGVVEFLRNVANFCNVIIFTASLPEYADPILDLIDTYNVISKRLYRASTITYAHRKNIKCLRRLGFELTRTVLVDNNPDKVNELCNVYPITSFYDNNCDDALSTLFIHLKMLADVKDVRPALKTLCSQDPTGFFR